MRFIYFFLIVLLCMLINGPALAVEVELVTGEVLEGELIEQSDSVVVLEHPILGRMEIPAQQVREVRAEAKKAEEERPEPDVISEAPPPWDSQFEAGANGANGNSESFDCRSSLVTQYKTEIVRIKLDAAYFYGSVRDTISRNEYYVGLINEWYFPQSRWSWFVQGRYDWNAFEAWYSRVSAATGVAYLLVNRDGLEALARGGGGFVREYGSENDEIRPEGLVGGEIDWRIAKAQKFFADTYYYPDFSDPGEYRLTSSLKWSADLEAADALSFVLGAQNEYRSKVDPGFDHNDLKYYAAIAIDF